MTDGHRSRPEKVTFAGHFTFDAEGIEIGTFMEVSGLSARVDVEELPEGGNNRFVHKLPGPVSWPNLVLRRGITRSNALLAWFATALQTGQVGAGGAQEVSPPPGQSAQVPAGQLQRRTATVSLRDAAGDVIRSWTVVDAFPVTWTGPTLAASANDVATEELEIAHHGFAPGA